MTFLRQQTCPGGRDTLPALDQEACCRMVVSERVCVCVYVWFITGVGFRDQCRFSKNKTSDIS